MFARTAALRPVVSAVAAARSVEQKAGMATLREIEGRLKSVRNIEKITKSMKVVASTKLSRAERAMKQAKAYGSANEELFKHLNEEAQPEMKTLYITVSSDRGLCGGIHSSVTKATRRALIDEPGSIVVLGDKSKAQLSRVTPESLTVTFNQIGKDIPTFAEAAAIADEITQHAGEWDQVKIIFNKYVSAISYEAGSTTVVNAKRLAEAPGFKAYEMEEDVSKDLAEFALANAIYATLAEAHAAEQSARRNAMDNASNNANDMIARLQLQYNRGRQAVITTELIDIITGASAL